MNKIRNLILGLVLGLGIVALVQGPAQAYTCSAYDPLFGTCIQYTVDLLPNAAWCGANPAPAANQILLFTSTNYTATTASSYINPLCQVITVGASNLSVSNLSTYDMNGPSYWIKSIWAGTDVQGLFYRYNSFGAPSTLINYGGYTSDTQYFWGYNPSSYTLHRR